MVKFDYLKSPLPEKEIVVAAATCRTMAEVTTKAREDVFDSTQVYEPNTCTKFNSHHRPMLPKGKSTTLVDMMKFVSEWFDFEESNDASCVTVGVGIVNCGDIIREDTINDFDVDKIENLDEQIGLEIEIIN